MRSSFFIAVLFVFAAAHAQSLKGVPVQLQNQNGLPGSIKFFCTEDYPYRACMDDVETLHQRLLRYPVEQLGQWIFVLATRNQSIAVQHRPDGSAETPAFTSLDHRTTVMERDLFSATADRSAELIRAFGLAGSALLELAISHELGHALCHEPDEHRVDDYGRELRAGRILSCSPSTGSSATRAAKVPTLPAEPHCPGNVASVPLRLTNSHQMIVAISVNHSGPYNFLLDTGTQMTMIDPSLAVELHLNTQGSAVVAGVGFQTAASFAQLDLLEVGSRAVANQKALVFDIKNPQSVDLRYRGVLGEDFLEQFDMLIDNAHSLLCLDDSDAMRADVKGPHIALLPAAETSNGGLPIRSLIISARLSDATQPVRLKLDSGTNAPFLFDRPHYMAPGFIRSVGGGLNGTQRSFSTLPPQDLKIGSLKFPNVSFVTFADSQRDSRTRTFDGLLTLGLFRSVFICQAAHFAVFEPW